MAEALFYLLALGAVASAVGVVIARNPLFSVLSLLAAFFCLASIYLLAGFQFLAVTQLLVYAGAIMVLFLFVIMLLNLGDEQAVDIEGTDSSDGIGRRRLVIAGASAGALLLVAAFSVGFGEVLAAPRGGPVTASGEMAFPEDGIDHLVPLAELLFSRYMLAFEASSLLLLATMIAVILLAKRQREDGTGGEAGAWPWTSTKTGERK